jgi:hypothetical protein
MTSRKSVADYHEIVNDVCRLQELIDKFKAAQLDQTEYACLKGIVLFKTGKCVYYLWSYGNYCSDFNVNLIGKSPAASL